MLQTIPIAPITPVPPASRPSPSHARPDNARASFADSLAPEPIASDDHAQSPPEHAQLPPADTDASPPPDAEPAPTDTAPHDEQPTPEEEPAPDVEQAELAPDARAGIDPVASVQVEPAAGPTPQPVASTPVANTAATDPTLTHTPPTLRPPGPAGPEGHAAREPGASVATPPQSGDDDRPQRSDAEPNTDAARRAARWGARIADRRAPSVQAPTPPNAVPPTPTPVEGEPPARAATTDPTIIRTPGPLDAKPTGDAAPATSQPVDRPRVAQTIGVAATPTAEVRPDDRAPSNLQLQPTPEQNQAHSDSVGAANASTDTGDPSSGKEPGHDLAGHTPAKPPVARADAPSPTPPVPTESTEPQAAAAPPPAPVVTEGVSAASLLTPMMSIEAEEAQSLRDVPAQERAPIKIVQRGLSAVLRQSGGALTVRLAPPHLGQVRIHMDLNASALTVDLEATTPQAHSLLKANVAALTSALESRGLTVDRINVQLAQSTSAAAPPAPTLADGPTTGARQDTAGQNTDHDAAGRESRGSGQGRGHASRDGGAATSFNDLIDGEELELQMSYDAIA